MPEDKPFGFAGLGSQSQSDFDKMRKAIEGERISWDELRKIEMRESERLRKFANEQAAPKARAGNRNAAETYVLATILSMTRIGNAMTCRLGVELSQTRERIAEIEKALKER